MRQAGVRPVTLAVAPSRATTPGYPGQLALWLGGFHIRAYPGETASPPSEVWLSVKRGRGGACPSRIPQGNARGPTGRASHGPYAQQRKKCSYFKRLFCVQISQKCLLRFRPLGTAAHQDKALVIEAQFPREAIIFCRISTLSM